jgi:small GTP-binding protein
MGINLGILSRNIKSYVTDTAGQERFHSLSYTFYRGADGCIFVFDITNRQTFDNLNIWIEEFRQKLNIENFDEFPIIVIGNKTDKEDSRMVSTKEAQEWCKNNNIKQYIECSAITSNNVEKAFYEISKLILEDNELLYIVELDFNKEKKIIKIEETNISCYANSCC